MIPLFDENSSLDTARSELRHVLELDHLGTLVQIALHPSAQSAWLDALLFLKAPRTSKRTVLYHSSLEYFVTKLAAQIASLGLSFRSFTTLESISKMQFEDVLCVLDAGFHWLTGQVFFQADWPNSAPPRIRLIHFSQKNEIVFKRNTAYLIQGPSQFFFSVSPPEISFPVADRGGCPPPVIFNATSLTTSGASRELVLDFENAVSEVAKPYFSIGRVDRLFDRAVLQLNGIDCAALIELYSKTFRADVSVLYTPSVTYTQNQWLLKSLIKPGCDYSIPLDQSRELLIVFLGKARSHHRLAKTIVKLHRKITDIQRFARAYFD